MQLFDLSIRTLEAGLRGAELRQEVIANNLANANTPGFKRSDVEFASALTNALRFGGDPGAVQPTVTVDEGTSMRVDGNNVDPDREATMLAESSMHFAAMMAATTKRLQTLQQIITGAR